MKKSLVLSALLATSMLAACGGNAPASNSNGGDGSGNTPAKVAKLSYGLSSPAEFSYHNMRPQYNYYLTTFSFQTLDLFDDGTYQLNDILMTFSAVVLPEEGQDGQGNERDNVVSRFYGKYTSAPYSRQACRLLRFFGVL